MILPDSRLKESSQGNKLFYEHQFLPNKIYFLRFSLAKINKLF